MKRWLFLALPLIGLVLALSVIAASETGTVEVTVSGQLVATGVDTLSSITIDPKTAAVVPFQSIETWAGTAASDDMVYNLTGTNVNFTVYATYDVELPPSYPQGMRLPYAGLVYLVAGTDSSMTITAPVVFYMANYTIQFGLRADYLLYQYINNDFAKLTWIDLPEGFLNELYSSVSTTKGGTLNETHWYNYTYAKRVTVPALVVKYDPTAGKYYVAQDVTVCMLVADPDNSTQNTGFSGDEAVVVGPSCDFDADNSNWTNATGSLWGDLASGNDYAFINGYGAGVPRSAQRYYDYNQTDFVVLNFTVTLSDGSQAIVYFTLYKSSIDLSKGVLNLALNPTYPVPYSAVLGPIYAAGYYPYLHVWPTILVPLGAPAGSYKATIYLYFQQT